MNNVFLERIYRSIDWLENNHEVDFDVRKMADISCFSAYHFSRIFYSMTGMTPALYYRRRSLTKAAHLIKNTDVNILSIALEIGYESQEAFTRSFKNMFNEAPAKFRKNKPDVKMLEQQPLALEDLYHIGAGGVSLEPVIKHHDNLTIYGLHKEICFDEYHLADNLWDQYLQNYQVSDVQYGVCSGTINKGVPSSKLSYYCGSKKYHPDLRAVDIEEGAYACFTHKGHLKNISTTLDYIWRGWLPKTKLQLRNAPDFELYDKRFNQETHGGEIEIWIPINE